MVTEEENITWDIGTIFEKVKPTYSLESISMIIPLGARIAGSSALYLGIYDGTYLRYDNPSGATVFFAIVHYM